MDNDAENMEIHAMGELGPEPRLRAGHFHEELGYETIREHGSDDWLLIVTVAGMGIHSGDHAAMLRPGSALLYVPGTPQHYLTDPETGFWELLWCHFFDAGRLLNLLQWPRLSDGAAVLQLGHVAGRVQSALSEAVDWYGGSSRRRFDFARNALERALLLCDTVNPVSACRPADSRVAAAVGIITDSIGAPLTVATLAEAVGLSPSRLSHLFKRTTGLSVPAFVEAARMERAQDLLYMTDRTVSEVAAAVGFDDPLYFSRRFRVHFGASPRAWRAAQ